MVEVIAGDVRRLIITLVQLLVPSSPKRDICQFILTFNRTNVNLH